MQRFVEDRTNRIYLVQESSIERSVSWRVLRRYSYVSSRLERDKFVIGYYSIHTIGLCPASTFLLSLSVYGRARKLWFISWGPSEPQLTSLFAPASTSLRRRSSLLMCVCWLRGYWFRRSMNQPYLRIPWAWIIIVLIKGYHRQSTGIRVSCETNYIERAWFTTFVVGLSFSQDSARNEILT